MTLISWSSLTVDRAQKKAAHRAWHPSIGDELERRLGKASFLKTAISEDNEPERFSSLLLTSRGNS